MFTYWVLFYPNGRYVDSIDMSNKNGLIFSLKYILTALNLFVSVPLLATLILFWSEKTKFRDFLLSLIPMKSYMTSLPLSAEHWYFIDNIKLTHYAKTMLWLVHVNTNNNTCWERKKERPTTKELRIQNDNKNILIIHLNN